MIMRQVSEKMTGAQTLRQQNVLKSCIFTNCIFAREFAICFSFAIYAQNKKVIKRFDSNALKNHNSNHSYVTYVIFGNVEYHWTHSFRVQVTATKTFACQILLYYIVCIVCVWIFEENFFCIRFNAEPKKNCVWLSSWKVNRFPRKIASDSGDSAMEKK